VPEGQSEIARRAGVLQHTGPASHLRLSVSVSDHDSFHAHVPAVVHIVVPGGQQVRLPLASRQTTDGQVKHVPKEVIQICDELQQVATPAEEVQITPDAQEQWQLESCWNPGGQGAGHDTHPVVPTGPQTDGGGQQMPDGHTWLPSGH
jgi:hypothetical protein